MRRRIIPIHPELSDHLFILLRHQRLRPIFVRRGRDFDFIAVPAEVYAKARWTLAMMRDR